MSNMNANNNKPNNSNNKTSLPADIRKKKTISLALGIILGICLIAILVVGVIANLPKQSDYDDKVETTVPIDTSEFLNSESTTETTTETTTQDLIEESGAIEICSGKDADGNVYKLVCTQDETYNKVTIKVGVIKNNQWIQKLSTKSPFLNDDATNLLGITKYSSPLEASEEDDGFEIYHYVADGVFALMPYYDHEYYLFYNANNSKTESVEYASWIKIFLADIDANGHYIVYSKNNDDNKTNNIVALDTNTMKEKVIIKNTNMSVTGAYNDGLFPLGLDNSIDYFYDISGEKIIDVKKDYQVFYIDNVHNNCYNTYGDGHAGITAPYFRNNTFEFCVRNSAGTRYNMSISKTGKLIKNEKH